jgi:hypothetical protein
MEATLLLAGLRLEETQVQKLREQVQTMNITTESSYYRLLINEGQIKEARKLVIHFGGMRLGPPDEATRAAIESINDLDVLERLLDRTLTASDWTQLLAERS